MSLDVSAVLTKLASSHRKKMMYRGKEITLEQTFALDGALPVLVKKANLLHDFLFGSKLQTTLKTDPNSLTGEVVIIPPTESSITLLMMLYDVFEEMVVAAGKKDEVSLG